MDSLGFFIDTGGKDDLVDDKNEQEFIVDEKEVLGARDAETERKQRERAQTERSLSSFLFGKPDDAEDIKDEDESSDSEDDVPSDLDDKDIDSDEDTNVTEEETDETTVKPVSVQPSLPEDVFGAALEIGSKRKKRKAAWVDKEDSEVLVKDVVATYTKAKGKHGMKETSEEQYGKSLSRRFKSVVGEPTWANLDREDEGEDSDEEFFRETTDLLEKKSKHENLQKSRLEFRKLKDVNYTTHKEGAVIRSVEFHPTSTVGLVAGNSGTCSLFQVDGKENPKIQTVNFENFPIKTAKFSANGNEFIVGSQQHPHFYIYDMMIGKIIKIPWKSRSQEHNCQKFEVSPDGSLLAFKGRFGHIHLVSARTKEFLHSFKMNGECLDLKFNKTGSELFTTGEGGEVYVWDLRSQTARVKFVDEGCLTGTSVAVSSRYLATGSSSGVVNMYKLDNLNQDVAYPQPEKAILNLTTEIEDLTFNPSGEMLAMSSMMKDGAIKLVHFPSMSVFNNFPGPSLKLGKINCLTFSPGGGYLGVGNNKGAANLYRISHYPTY